MTEADWLAATDPRPLIRSLNGLLAERKARLFAVACCRLVAAHFTEPVCGAAVDLAERFADRLISEGGIGPAWAAVQQPASRWDAPQDVGWSADMAAAVVAGRHLAGGAWHKDAIVVSRLVMRIDPSNLPTQLALFHCVVGNPFRPVVADPRWRTSTVVELADGIYADRAFDRLPFLADALEEAGCEHPDVLAHCRDGGPHARGCWVVDLVRPAGG